MSHVGLASLYLSVDIIVSIRLRFNFKPSILERLTSVKSWLLNDMIIAEAAEHKASVVKF